MLYELDYIGMVVEWQERRAYLFLFPQVQPRRFASGVDVENPKTSVGVGNKEALITQGD